MSNCGREEAVECREGAGIRKLQEMVDIIQEELTKRGLSDQGARDIALATIERFRFVFGGEQLYFPTGQTLNISNRDMDVWKEFDGSNHRELSKKHRCTVRNVQRIIAKVRKELSLRGQNGGNS